jgi:flagellar hook-associated protein 1 FlgK
LENAGQNIANANTEGYSRQRVGMAAVGAPVQPAIFAVGDPAGSGVKISELTRFRDEFLESRARAERSSNSYLTERKAIYARIEQVVGEPSDTGVQSQLAEYWSAWHDLANRPGDAAARTQLLQRGTTLTDSIKDAYSSLGSLWGSTREQFDTYVVEINTAAAAVAQLNESVVRTKQAGLPGNELADQRDLAVLKLAELTGGMAIPKENGAVDFAIFGSSLVSGARSRALEAYGATRMGDQPTDPVGIRWADTQAAAVVPSGKIASTLESLGSTIPNTVTGLDAVVSELMTAVNTQHAAGFDLTGTAGGDFFTGTGAKDFAVAFTDPNLIAAAGSAPVPPATKTLDGSNADLIAGLASLPTGPDNRYRQFVVDLGVAAQSTYRRSDIQQAITDDIDAARTAESGVNLDEEMMSLVAYQRAYEAAAKVMSVIDASLDALINGLRR